MTKINIYSNEIYCFKNSIHTFYMKKNITEIDIKWYLLNAYKPKRILLVLNFTTNIIYLHFQNRNIKHNIYFYKHPNIKFTHRYLKK